MPKSQTSQAATANPAINAKTMMACFIAPTDQQQRRAVAANDARFENGRNGLLSSPRGCG
jgi:hypothetical protein